MKIKRWACLSMLCIATALTVPSIGISQEAPACIKPVWTTTATWSTGRHNWVCETYFLGINVNTSTAACQDTTNSLPGHYHCSEISSTVEDCVVGAAPTVLTTQQWKGECESSSGLTVEVFGVEFTIGWWKAVCKRDGAPITVAHSADGRIGCYEIIAPEPPSNSGE